MDNDGREFFSAGAVSNDQLDALPAKVLSLMGRIRPHSVRLVDAWSIPDYLLDRHSLPSPRYQDLDMAYTLTVRSAATMARSTKICSIAPIV